MKNEVRTPVEGLVVAGGEPVFAFFLGVLINGNIDHRCCQQRTLHVVFLDMFCSDNTDTLA